MNNKEIEARLSAIEKSITGLRKDVDTLLSDKQNRDKANKQIELILGSDYSEQLAKMLKIVPS